jgi:TonB family protein
LNVLDSPNPPAWQRSPEELRSERDGATVDPHANAPTLEVELGARRAPLPSRRKEGLGFLALIAVASVAHAAIFAALISVPADLAGAGGVELEAISVEVALISASALESRTKEAAPPDGGAHFDLTTGSTAKTSTEAPAAEADPPRVEADKRPIDLTPDPEPSLPDAALLATPKSIEAPQAKNDGPNEQRKPDKPLEPRPEPSAEASAEGGAASRASVKQAPRTNAAAAASPGAVLAYARSVVDALARARPKPDRAVKGTVRVLFAIGENGLVETVSLKQSSGRADLDGLAIAAVRKTRFPPPPPGMSRTARTYEVPYHFR